MKSLKAETEVIPIEDHSRLAPEIGSLLLAAEEATKTAYAPYSHFPVGAAILLEDGTIFTGSNQENMAFPSGLCAERVAIFACSAQHPGKFIKAIAVCILKSGPDDHFASPCGACRQSMYEYEWKQRQKIPLYLTISGKTTWKVDSVGSLLPFPFAFLNEF